MLLFAKDFAQPPPHPIPEHRRANFSRSDKSNSREGAWLGPWQDREGKERSPKTLAFAPDALELGVKS